MDPPAFTKGKEREEAERMAVEQGDGSEGQGLRNARKTGNTYTQ